jgi:hypothetical protein
MSLSDYLIQAGLKPRPSERPPRSSAELRLLEDLTNQFAAAGAAAFGAETTALLLEENDRSSDNESRLSAEDESASNDFVYDGHGSEISSLVGYLREVEGELRVESAKSATLAYELRGVQIQHAETCGRAAMFETRLAEAVEREGELAVRVAELTADRLQRVEEAAGKDAQLAAAHAEAAEAAEAAVQAARLELELLALRAAAAPSASVACVAAAAAPAPSFAVSGGSQVRIL